MDVQLGNKQYALQMQLTYNMSFEYAMNVHTKYSYSER